MPWSRRHATRAKYKYEPKLECFTLSRTLMAGLSYPFNWGFVPSTIAADGDPLDVAILADVEVFAGLVLPCRPIGVLEVEQTEKGKTLRNDRVFLSPLESGGRCANDSVMDLTEAQRQELEEFFVASVTGTGKRLKMLGWHGPARALQAVKDAAQQYQKQAQQENGQAEKQKAQAK